MDLIQSVVDDLLDLGDSTPALTEVRGLAVGALFSLLSAQLVSGAERLPKDQAELSEDLYDVLDSIRKGERPTKQRWLAGFYLNSAVLRLAFSAERTLQIIAPPVPTNDDPFLLQLCHSRKKKRSFCYLIEDAKSEGILTHPEADQLHALRRDVNRIKHKPTDVTEREVRNLDEAKSLLTVLRKLLRFAGAPRSSESGA